MILVANTSYLLDPNLEQDSNTIQPIKCLLTRHFILKQGAPMSKIEWVIMSLSKINRIIHISCDIFLILYKIVITISIMLIGKVDIRPPKTWNLFCQTLFSYE